MKMISGADAQKAVHCHLAECPRTLGGMIEGLYHRRKSNARKRREGDRTKVLDPPTTLYMDTYVHTCTCFRTDDFSQGYRRLYGDSVEGDLGRGVGMEEKVEENGGKGQFVRHAFCSYDQRKRIIFDVFRSGKVPLLLKRSPWNYE